jgi:2-hydroxy-3-keto-5-methylthiopentenyl-1-phosphate phosphatase
MIEWWTKSQNLTVATNINRDNIVEMVKKSNTQLRDGCNSFFYSLERNEIPIMIFSAGIGKLIKLKLLFLIPFNCFLSKEILFKNLLFNNVVIMKI